MGSVQPYLQATVSCANLKYVATVLHNCMADIFELLKSTILVAKSNYKYMLCI